MLNTPNFATVKQFISDPTISKKERFVRQAVMVGMPALLCLGLGALCGSVRELADNKSELATADRNFACATYIASLGNRLTVRFEDIDASTISNCSLTDSARQLNAIYPNNNLGNGISISTAATVTFDPTAIMDHNVAGYTALANAKNYNQAMWEVPAALSGIIGGLGGFCLVDELNIRASKATQSNSVDQSE